MALSFLSEYATNPRTVGAVFPSSKRLAQKIMGNIDFGNCQCIVEYGPGTGVFTDELIIRRQKETTLLLVEYNTEFYKYLKERYCNIENLIIINGSAENIDIYLNNHNIKSVDYIVSGLPFASLEKTMANKILQKSKDILGEDGKFIAFQYTLFKKGFIEHYFKSIKIEKEHLNIPPAYVFTCRNL